MFRGLCRGLCRKAANLACLPLCLDPLQANGAPVLLPGGRPVDDAGSGGAV